MLEKTLPTKYVDPRNMKIIVQIGKTVIPNTLVDIGNAINVMNRETL